MKYKCSSCKGSGKIIHPFWDEYQKSEKKDNPAVAYAEWSGSFNGVLPPKIVPCPICNGKGHFSSRWHKLFFEHTNGNIVMTVDEFIQALSKVQKKRTRRKLPQ